jgi:poly-gamma-glutamate synthesis protein (capsule biosynthesis protein)
LKKFLSIAGASICFVLSFALIRGSITGIAGMDLGAKHEWRSGRRSVRMLVFGDVNLGRMVGQKILEDEIDYPFQKISIQRNSGDIVFANLECQLSEQDGETQDPAHNLIFTGPPNGARALASFGFTLVSTANNHAFDYGKDALFETLDHLDEQGIAHAGTTRSAKYLYEPLVFEREGIRFAMFAVTDLMNFKNGWHDFVAVTDTGKLFPAIREAVSSVDVVLVSFHGGDEYSDEPTSRVRDFAEECVRQGVKVFLGHHPHVPYGVIKKDGSYIFHSLGNFVFYQPQLFWTQVSFGAELRFEKTDTSIVVAAVEYIPLRVGYQPSILTDSSIVRQLQRRLEALSNIPITLTRNGYLN